MSFAQRTQQCYPMSVNLPGLPTMPAPEPDHEHCPGGHHLKGVLGGWHCPCPCHSLGESS